MKKNVGNTDKLIRLMIAVFIIVLSYKKVITNPTLDIVLLVVALIVAITSLLNYCPIYSLFKINTNKKM